MSMALGLYLAIFGVLLAALLVRARLGNHILIGVVGAIGLIYGVWIHGFLAGVLPLLILLVAGVQVASVIGANQAAKFTAEEKTMLEGPLAGLGRAQARRLMDQGIWMDAREGDVLI